MSVRSHLLFCYCILQLKKQKQGFRCNIWASWSSIPGSGDKNGHGSLGGGGSNLADEVTESSVQVSTQSEIKDFQEA